MQTAQEFVEAKYNGFFPPVEKTDFPDLSAREIFRALTNKRRTFWRDDHGVSLEGVCAAIKEKRPIKVRVAWGYGKDPAFRELDVDWFKPDLADVYTLAVVSSFISGSPHPLEVRITGSWDRFLNLNYYSISTKPEEWFEQGLLTFAKDFKSLAENLLPDVKVFDTYGPARDAGINMDAEVERPEVSDAVKAYREKNEEYVWALEGSVKKHSKDWARSVDRYLRERAVEKLHGLDGADLTLHFAKEVPGSIQYLTVPNRAAFETLPPWESKGGMYQNGDSWRERMFGLMKIAACGAPDSTQAFKIKSQIVNGLVYARQI